MPKIKINKNKKGGKANRKKNVFLISLLCINLLLIGCFIYFLSPVNKTGDNVSFVIEEGDSVSEIASNLKNEGLIKSDKFFTLYVVLTGKSNIYAAKYVLNDNMKLSDIVNVLDEGGVNANEITITFKEGLNMRQIAKVIEDNTNNSANDVIALANDKAYINSLIKEYWFITNDVKTNGIYYSLEGYLFPDSYNFSSRDVSVKEIFHEMIVNMDKNLSKYKKNITKSGYSVHDILTMASILELEGLDSSSRSDIAGVFYNRLDSKMSLGSDVTTYYGVKKDMTSDLTMSELDAVNGYNTRASGMEGKLPVGPICNSSIESIKAAISPSKHNYYYFVADKNGEIYLTKDYNAHNKVISELKAEGLWFEW